MPELNTLGGTIKTTLDAEPNVAIYTETEQSKLGLITITSPLDLDALNARLPVGTVVGTTDTQTLSAKTLTDPKATYTVFDAGTKSTGIFTPAYADGVMQKATNDGAHTLAPQSGNGVIYLLYTNGASAGTLTTSGYTITKGDALTTTNAHKFLLSSVVVDTISVINVIALQ